MRLICSIHDVTPARIGESCALREMLSDRAPGPVALLVIPDEGGAGRWRPGPALAWLHARARAGDELVVHGLTHRSPAGRDGAETAGLGARRVAALVAEGAASLERAGLPGAGFIAPAYGHAAGLPDAVARAGLVWWADRFRLYWDGGSRSLPSLGLGASSGVRRALSPPVARGAARALGRAECVRLDLHTADLHHPRLARAAERLVARLVGQGRLAALHGDLVPGHPRNLAPC